MTDPKSKGDSADGAPSAGSVIDDTFFTDEIFVRISAAADHELDCKTQQLFFSGLAAGLSISLAFIARAAVEANSPAAMASLMGCLLYPVGFLLVVLGRYQLFTENTLTPVTLVLTRMASLPVLLRLWGVVLAANLLGAGIAAFVLAQTNLFDEKTAIVANSLAHHALSPPPTDLFWRAVIAGWLVANIVWMNYAVREAVTRFLIVFIIAFLMGIANLAHCVVGTCEVLYLVFRGEVSIATYIIDFLGPVIMGNTLGGVVLVALLNYSQARISHFRARDGGQNAMGWRRWFFSYHRQPTTVSLNNAEIS